jgi:hypothetical protein
MKFVEPRPFADPDAAACKLVEIASIIEPVQNAIGDDHVGGNWLLWGFQD